MNQTPNGDCYSTLISINSTAIFIHSFAASTLDPPFAIISTTNANMKFSIATICTLAACVAAAPVSEPEALEARQFGTTLYCPQGRTTGCCMI